MVKAKRHAHRRQVVKRRLYCKQIVKKNVQLVHFEGKLETIWKELLWKVVLTPPESCMSARHTDLVFTLFQFLSVISQPQMLLKIFSFFFIQTDWNLKEIQVNSKWIFFGCREYICFISSRNIRHNWQINEKLWLAVMTNEVLLNGD